MAHAKWIGGFLGLLSGGPIGALAGFVLGALFDAVAGDNGLQEAVLGNETEGGYGGGYAGGGGTYTGSGYDGSGYRRSYRNGVDEGTRNGFLFSLLTLASYIIKADGKIMHSEMEAMRSFQKKFFR